MYLTVAFFHQIKLHDFLYSKPFQISFILRFRQLHSLRWVVSAYLKRVFTFFKKCEFYHTLQFRHKCVQTSQFGKKINKTKSAETGSNFHCKNRTETQRKWRFSLRLFYKYHMTKAIQSKERCYRRKIFNYDISRIWFEQKTYFQFRTFNPSQFYARTGLKCKVKIVAKNHIKTPITCRFFGNICYLGKGRPTATSYV